MALTNAEFAEEFVDVLEAHISVIDPTGFEAELETLLNQWLEGAITIAELARKLTETLGYWNQNQLEFKSWYAGTETGGYNSDGTPSNGVAPNGGYYPLTNGVGSTSYFPSPAKLINSMLRGQNAAADVHTYFQGNFANNEVLGRYLHSGTNVTFDPVTSRANSKLASTGAKTITITKNGSAWATVSWSAAATTGTVSITGGAVAAGDILEFVAPATSDATLSDVTIHLAAFL